MSAQITLVWQRLLFPETFKKVILGYIKSLSTEIYDYMHFIKGLRNISWLCLSRPHGFWSRIYTFDLQWLVIDGIKNRGKSFRFVCLGAWRTGNNTQASGSSRDSGKVGVGDASQIPGWSMKWQIRSHRKDVVSLVLDTNNLLHLRNI